SGLLQLLAQILWWFHPLVWLANHEACRECERCCDEETVAELGCRPGQYARCLLDVASQRPTYSPALGWPGIRTTQVTAQRIKSIMDRTRSLNRRTPRWYWAFGIVMAAAILPGAELLSTDEGVASNASVLQSSDQPDELGFKELPTTS